MIVSVLLALIAFLAWVGMATLLMLGIGKTIGLRDRRH